jgi:HK97 family phage prohead protease
MRKQQFISEIKDAGPNRRTFIISTDAVDRDNDTVNPRGWKLDHFLKNPVVLYSHDYSSLPIGKCVDIRVVNDKLVATVEFADHDMAREVLKLVDGGFLNATSVGFRPINGRRNTERGGMDFEQQELLEFSIVPVPSNPEALITIQRSLRPWMSAFKEGRRHSAADQARLNDIHDAVRELGSPCRNVDDLDEDEDVLDIVDSPLPTRSFGGREIDFDPADLAAALRETQPFIRQTVRAIAAEAMKDARQRLRGEPWQDPSTRRHSDDVFDIDEDDVLEILRTTAREVVRDSVTEGIKTGIGRARGRVD